MTRRALIIVDLQNDYFPEGKLPLRNILPAANNAARLLAGARAAGEFIVHIRHEFEAADAPFFVAGSEGARIATVVQDRAPEPVLVKHRPNSFLGTGLNELLASHDASEVIIAGAMVHMCIDATARAAADLGYRVVVIQDAVATRDLVFGGIEVPAAHVEAAFLAALGSSYATIRSTDEQLRLQGAGV